MQREERFVKFLGEGAYGSVDLLNYTNPDGSSFQAAAKTSYSDVHEYLLKEVQILSELSGYPNIVQCFGNDLEETCDLKGNKVYRLLMEYASEGCLSDFMGKFTDRKLPVPMIRVFTSMILEGLVSIHSHGYVHCDLKSDNLLVFPLSDSSYSSASSYEVKISDFGNALEVGEVPDFWANDYPYVGTPCYMPPESFRNGVANKTLDLWSLGCLVLEMFTGERPWKGVGIHDLTNLLLEGKAPEIPESLPCDAREFIETCFSRNPEDRGTALDLLSHWFLCREEEVEKIVSSDVSVVEENRREAEEKIVSDVAVVEESRRESEEETFSDFVMVEERREIEEKMVEESRRDSSLLLRLKLKLSIKRALKKSVNNTEKKSLKLKIFPSKPQQFKKLFNKILGLKTMPMNSLDTSLVSVQ